jgi:deazaflavin-dependent oxidoreductase (nitroreductase family)
MCVFSRFCRLRTGEGALTAPRESVDAWHHSASDTCRRIPSTEGTNMQIVRQPTPPTGLRRLLWRLPVALYRLGWGRLLGRRLMLLTHTGRVSGRPRRAVVEVVRHDDHGYVAASGFGRRADWYRNVMATPHVTLQVGGRTIEATAAAVPTDEGAEIMAEYAPRHPAAAQLCKIMGFAVDGSAADFREVGRRIPFVRFTPDQGRSGGLEPDDRR